MSRHTPARIEMVARAIWGEDASEAGDADEIVSCGVPNWQLCTEDAVRILDALSAAGALVPEPDADG